MTTESGLTEAHSGKSHNFSLRRANVNNLDNLLERNQEFAAQQAAASTLMPWLPSALPNVKAIIIGCADMRVDPVHLFGIRPGEAVVFRNIGGRITPGLLQQFGLLGRIGEVAGEIPGGGGEFHLIVLHHTDCGITRLANESAMLSQYFQVPESELKKKAVLDPRAAVVIDIAFLRTIPAPTGIKPAPWGLYRFHQSRLPHFVTFTCYRRQSFLNYPSVRDAFLRVLERTRLRYDFLVYGFVVMPNHIHLLISEPQCGTIATVIQWLKIASARHEKTHLCQTKPDMGHDVQGRPFWQRRYYDRNVRNDEEFIHAFKYIHCKPG